MRSLDTGRHVLRSRRVLDTPNGSSKNVFGWTVADRMGDIDLLLLAFCEWHVKWIVRVDDARFSLLSGSEPWHLRFGVRLLRRPADLLLPPC